MSTVRAASQRDLIPDRLAHHASTRPDDPALLARTASGDFTPISWQQYDQRARLIAAAYLAVGLPVGGAVAILGDSRAEWVLAAVGTFYAGGVATGIYQTSTADQVAYILRHSDALVAVIENPAQWRKVRPHLPSLPQLRRVVLIEGAAELPEEDRGLTSPIGGPLCQSWDDFLRSGKSHEPAVPERLAALTPEQLAVIIYTSGTTGTPKGVLVSHDGLTHFGRVSAESRALGPDDRSYAALPMTHIFGLATLLAASLHAGAAMVMRTRFDAADAFDALARHGVSQLQGPPTMFVRMLAHAQATGLVRPQAPQLRYLYTGAGPLELGLKQRVEACFGQPLHHGYGLSEFAGSVHVTALGQHRADTATGLRVEGAESRIVGPDGQDLPAGERGEIWLRGRGLFPGYFRNAEATAQVMRPGGWYASGDLGCLGADGALFVLGRLKEMIIRSGFNVYPAAVEAAPSALARTDLGTWRAAAVHGSRCQTIDSAER